MGIYEELQARGLIAQVTDEEHIRDMVNNGKATFYIGFDCTADSLHVGHFMALCLMKRLQMAGNRPIALIGGGTTMIGDPSGRTDMRKMLTKEDIDHNAACFKRQRLLPVSARAERRTNRQRHQQSNCFFHFLFLLFRVDNGLDAIFPIGIDRKAVIGPDAVIAGSGAGRLILRFQRLSDCQHQRCRVLIDEGKRRFQCARLLGRFFRLLRRRIVGLLCCFFRFLRRRFRLRVGSFLRKRLRRCLLRIRRGRLGCRLRRFPAGTQQRQTKRQHQNGNALFQNRSPLFCAFNA